mmetsp:Transcript_53771/g.172373  ORF Transcript_53771/g.172373 Transcript_53771/m.172373 type:complete len:247 (+) Transcript_53771:702-1442(+)
MWTGEPLPHRLRQPGLRLPLWLLVLPWPAAAEARLLALQPEEDEERRRPGEGGGRSHAPLGEAAPSASALSVAGTGAPSASTAAAPAAGPSAAACPRQGGRNVLARRPLLRRRVRTFRSVKKRLAASLSPGVISRGVAGAGSARRRPGATGRSGCLPNRLKTPCRGDCGPPSPGPPVPRQGTISALANARFSPDPGLSNSLCRSVGAGRAGAPRAGAAGAGAGCCHLSPCCQSSPRTSLQCKPLEF